MRRIILNGASCHFSAEIDRTYGNIRVYGTPYEAEVYVGNRKIYSGSADLGTAIYVDDPAAVEAEGFATVEMALGELEDKWFVRGYGHRWKWRIPIARRHELYAACQRFEARVNNGRIRKEFSGCYLRKGVGK